MYSCIWQSTRKKALRKVLAEFQQRQPDCQGPAKSGVFPWEMAKQSCWGGTRRVKRVPPQALGNSVGTQAYGGPSLGHSQLTRAVGSWRVPLMKHLGQTPTAPGGWHGILSCRQCGGSPRGLGKASQKWGCPQGPDIIMQRCNISTKKVVHISHPAMD